MSNQMQNNDFLLDSINESIGAGADAITAQYALHKLNTVGSVNIQECTTVFLMAQEILTEGSDDLIPDNIEIPDELEDSEDGEDLDVSDLEGIVLPTADGGLMVVENGLGAADKLTADNQIHDQYRIDYFLISQVKE